MFDPHGYAGRPLPTGPSVLRSAFRRALKLPKGDPIRVAVEKWAEARAESGLGFAVPANWYPRRKRWWHR